MHELAKIKTERIQIEITKNEPKKETLYSLVAVHFEEISKPNNMYSIWHQEPKYKLGTYYESDSKIIHSGAWGTQKDLKNQCNKLIMMKKNLKLYLFKKIGHSDKRKQKGIYKLLEIWEAKEINSAETLRVSQCKNW